MEAAEPCYRNDLPDLTGLRGSLYAEHCYRNDLPDLTGISVECDGAEFASRWVHLDFQRRLRLLLCGLRFGSGASDLDSWGTYTVVNSLIDLFDAWMIFRVFFDSLVSLELHASADAISKKSDSCECRKMGCSHNPNPQEVFKLAEVLYFKISSQILLKRLHFVLVISCKDHIINIRD